MKKAKFNVGLFGIGAIGSVIGSVLSQNKLISMAYFNRSKKESLKVKYGESKNNIPIKLESTLNLSKELDWLIIAIKEYDYVNARKTLKELIKPKTNIAIIRNGLNLYESLHGLANRSNVLECLIDCPTQKNDEDYYNQITKGKIVVQNNALSNSFAKLFGENEQLVIEQTVDFKTASWEKLIESSSLGAILALSGETCWIFEDQELINLYKKIVIESLQVGIKDGAKIDSNYKDQLILKLKKYPSTKGSSMLTDRLNNRRIELMAKNGIISELGKKYKLETPLNDLIYNLLKYTNIKKNVY
ncbi:MAG: ketopantoate reductase family protein [Aureispira sp.]|nr:ketopantoate reductase family protein [Aureispira sp.]